MKTKAICYITLKAAYPNWVGTAEKRFFTVEGTRLLLKSAPFMAGGGEITGYVIWERLH
jgi:hypothetical protein